MIRNTILFFVMGLALLSCSKDNSLISNKMSAKIDGKEWGTILPVTVLTNNKFIITGTSISGAIINIDIDGDTKGTYAVSLSAVQFVATYKASITATAEDIYACTSGTVELTKVDKTAKKISGTFQFTLKKDLTQETISVTNGTFTDISYNEQ